jgi:hypothetical protein
MLAQVSQTSIYREETKRPRLPEGGQIQEEGQEEIRLQRLLQRRQGGEEIPRLHRDEEGEPRALRGADGLPRIRGRRQNGDLRPCDPRVALRDRKAAPQRGRKGRRSLLRRPRVRDRDGRLRQGVPIHPHGQRSLLLRLRGDRILRRNRGKEDHGLLLRPLRQQPKGQRREHKRAA